MSHSDFGFQVWINEHFCFPNLFLLSLYINFTNFSARTGQNFARNLLVPSLESYHCDYIYPKITMGHFFWDTLYILFNSLLEPLKWGRVTWAAKVGTTGKVAARSEVMLRMPCQNLSHPPFELHTYIYTMLLYFQNYICYNNTTFLQLNHSNFNFFLN